MSIWNTVLGGLSNIVLGGAQIRAQKAENEKNRQWNKMLAEYQNAENLAQWNRQNKYNSPAQQMARLAAAGMNPDMVYGSGAAGLVSGDSPEMTGGAGSLPANLTAGFATIGQGITQAAQADLIASQAEKNRADAEQSRSAVPVNESLIDVNNSQVRLNNAAVELTLSNADKSKMESKMFQQTIAKINSDIETNEARIDELRKSAMTLNYEAAIKRIQMFYEPQRQRKLLDKLMVEIRSLQQGISESSSRVHLNERQVLNMLQDYSINEMTKGTKQEHLENLSEFLRKLGVKTEIENDILRAQAGYADAQSFANVIKTITGSAVDAGSFLLKVPSTAPKIGFR